MFYQFSEKRSTGNRLSSTPIHLLGDDSLLIIFSFCRPVILDKDEAEIAQLLDRGEWSRERWWHRLTQVCHRWRYLIFDSAFHLQVSLVCARGTPVADMLAHSPPVPLIIDHIDDEYFLSAEDEEGIILALQHRDRVRRIRIRKSVSIVQKLVIALEGEFPILEHLLIEHQRFHRPVIDHITNLSFPETFRAPHLRHLVLENFATPIDSPSLTTMANLVTLALSKIPSSAYFHPNEILQWLFLLPQLEEFSISFSCYKPVERQMLRTSMMTQVMLPNLRDFGFVGTSAYLEALLPWITIPLLERLHVYFFNRMVYTIPHLRQFMNTTRYLRLKTAMFTFFENHLSVVAYPHMGARVHTFSMELGAKHLDWQVVSAAQVFRALKTVFSTVEHLTFEYDRHFLSSEWNRQADRTYWREFLGSFDKVKTLLVEDELVEQVSRALQPGDGESPTKLLPELQVLAYPRSGASRTFAPFIQFFDARQKAGRPVTVNRF